MTEPTRSAVVAIGGGVVVGIVVAGVFLAVTLWWPSAEPYPSWRHIIGHIESALQAVAPGVVTGNLSRRPSFLAGALAGLVCVLLKVAGAFLLVGAEVIRDTALPEIANILGVVLATAGTNGIAGIAGGALYFGRIAALAKSEGAGSRES
jgi:hypothetical protein